MTVRNPDHAHSPASCRHAPPRARRRSIAVCGGGARLLVAALLGVLAAVLVSCGSSSAGLIPAQSAGPLLRDFQAVEAAAKVGNGSCATTEAALRTTESNFHTLPSSVDAGLRARLEEGISHLRERALALCAEPLSQTTTTGESTSTTKTTAPPTATTETQTTTSESTPTTGTTPGATQTSGTEGGTAPGVGGAEGQGGEGGAGSGEQGAAGNGSGEGAKNGGAANGGTGSGGGSGSSGGEQ